MTTGLGGVTLLNPSDADLYDIGLNGVGFRLAWRFDTTGLFFRRTPYEVNEDDILVPRRDTTHDMSEDKLDWAYWRSQRSWHLGAGQFRADQPNVSQNEAFYSSKGIDVFSKLGQATLLPSCTRVLTLTNSGPNRPQVMTASDSSVYVSAGSGNLKRFSALDGTDAATVALGADTHDTLSLTSDGAIVYAAQQSGGTYKIPTATTTQVQSFDSGAWTDSGVTTSFDSTTFKEGVASLKVVNTSTSTGTSLKAIGPVDLSAKDQFTVWVQATRNTAAGDLKLRLQTSPGNYYERSLPALTANVWTQDTSVRTTNWTSTGAPNWASIAATVVVENGLSAPAYVSKTQTGIAINPNQAHFITLSMPSGTAVGDTVLASIGCRADTAGTITIDTPSGWTLINSQTLSSQYRLSTYYRVLDGTEGATQSFHCISSVTTANLNVQGIAQAWRGADPSPVQVSGGQSNASSASVTAPSITTTGTNTQLIFVGGLLYNAGSANMTPPSGMSETAQQNSNGNQILETAHVTKATAGATGTKVAGSTIAGVNAGQLIALQPPTAGYVARFDDLEAVVLGTASTYSAHVANVVSWCKDRLFAAGPQTAGNTTWDFYEAGASDTVRLTLPDGFQVSDIKALGGYVYFSAYRNSRGVIYKYDGTNTPSIAVELPLGEQPISMTPFLGAGLLVGARRLGTINTVGGQGLVYRAFPDSAGNLTLERVQTIGKDDGLDYSPKTGFSYKDYVYFGWNYFGDLFAGSPDGSNSGLGIYYPTYGGLATHIYGNTSGIVEGAVPFKSRRIFSLGGDGVYVEQSTYLTTGNIVSSIYDWNIDKSKMLLTGEAGYLPLPSGATVAEDYSTDQSTWTNLFTDSTAGDSQQSGVIYALANSVQDRVTLGGDGAETPTLKKAGISAIYGTKPKRVFRMALMANDQMPLKNNAPYPKEGPSLTWSIINGLETLRSAQTIFTFQPLGFELTGEQVSARIGLVNYTVEFAQNTGFESVVIIEINEVPS